MRRPECRPLRKAGRRLKGDGFGGVQTVYQMIRRPKFRFCQCAQMLPRRDVTNWCVVCVGVRIAALAVVAFARSAKVQSGAFA